MHGRKIVPILLTFGLLQMLVRHGPLGQHGECEPHGPEGHHAEWQKRVPPIVEKWHQRMHESQPTAPSAAV